MSFLVTRVPGTQWPDAAGPAWHACVNAPTTTTSPLTTAWLYTVWCLQSRLPGPNHCGLQDRLPVNTLGVHLTGVCETRSGNAMDELDSARAVAAAGPATAAGALTPSSPPLATSAVTLATAAVIQRRCLICSPAGGPSPRRASGQQGLPFAKKVRIPARSALYLAMKITAGNRG